MVEWNEYNEKRYSSRNRLILSEYQAMTTEFVKYFAGLDTSLVVLDAGCSDGFFMEILRNLGFESIYGIDTSIPSLQIAREKGLQVVEGSIYDLDVRDKLNVVLLCDVLEYLENPGLAISRAYDALKEDGIIYIIVTIYDSPSGRFRGWFRRKKIEKIKQDDEANQRVFSKADILLLLESYQLKIEHTVDTGNQHSGRDAAVQGNRFRSKYGKLVSIVARKKISKRAVVTPKLDPSERESEEETSLPFVEIQSEEREGLTDGLAPKEEDEEEDNDETL